MTNQTIMKTWNKITEDPASIPAEGVFLLVSDGEDWCEAYLERGKWRTDGGLYPLHMFSYWIIPEPVKIAETEFLLPTSEVHHANTEAPVCPHCGSDAIENKSWNAHQWETDDWLCGKCGERFEVKVKYETRKV